LTTHDSNDPVLGIHIDETQWLNSIKKYEKNLTRSDIVKVSLRHDECVATAKEVVFHAKFIILNFRQNNGDIGISLFKEMFLVSTTQITRISCQIKAELKNCESSVIYNELLSDLAKFRVNIYPYWDHWGYTNTL